MMATHEDYHAFTASTRLVAKEPDHLTTCNTVESERVLFSTQRCRERPKILHESDSRAKKHKTHYLLFSWIGVFISHLQRTWRSRRFRASDDEANRRQNGSTMGFSIYIVYTMGRYGLSVIPTVNHLLFDDCKLGQDLVQQRPQTAEDPRKSPRRSSFYIRIIDSIFKGFYPDYRNDLLKKVYRR